MYTAKCICLHVNEIIFQEKSTLPYIFVNYCWVFIFLEFEPFLLLPPANEIWGKVMFLHLSVSHSVHRRGVCLWVWRGGGCLPLGLGGVCLSVQGGLGVGCDDCLWVWVVCLWVRGGVYHIPGYTQSWTHTHTHTHTHTPVEVAIEEGGTHPTGVFVISVLETAVNCIN